MTRYLLAALLALTGTAARAYPTTPRLGGLTLIPVGTAGWGPLNNNNFSQISTNVASQVDPNTFIDTQTYTYTGALFLMNLSTSVEFSPGTPNIGIQWADGSISTTAATSIASWASIPNTNNVSSTTFLDGVKVSTSPLSIYSPRSTNMLTVSDINSYSQMVVNDPSNGNVNLYLSNTSGTIEDIINPSGVSFINGGSLGIGLAAGNILYSLDDYNNARIGAQLIVVGTTTVQGADASGIGLSVTNGVNVGAGVRASTIAATNTSSYSVVASSGIDILAGGVSINGAQGYSGALSASQTVCGGTWLGGINVGGSPCAASGGGVAALVSTQTWSGSNTFAGTGVTTTTFQDSVNLALGSTMTVSAGSAIQMNSGAAFNLQAGSTMTLHNAGLIDVPVFLSSQSFSAASSVSFGLNASTGATVSCTVTISTWATTTGYPELTFNGDSTSGHYAYGIQYGAGGGNAFASSNSAAFIALTVPAVTVVVTGHVTIPFTYQYLSGNTDVSIGSTYYYSSETVSSVGGGSYYVPAQPRYATITDSAGVMTGYLRCTQLNY